MQPEPCHTALSARARRRAVSLLAPFVLAALACPPSLASGEEPLEPGVRGLATRAPDEMSIDGDLAEFAGAYCTPVNYFQPDPANRAAQFYYMWDDEAFYVGLRTLDQRRANPGDDNSLWNGDGVEWYFDTRRGDDFRARNWGQGAVHMYWTGYHNDQIVPRWVVRGDMREGFPSEGIEVAARETAYGSEVEFKLPWANFPDFQAAAGEVIALDAELCYGDGGARVDRTFAYGSPLSVEQPASQAPVQLVDHLRSDDWSQIVAAMMPLRCDTAWNQPTRALVTGQMVLPPGHRDQVGKVVFRLVDLAGETIEEYEGEARAINEDADFWIARAQWPTDVAVPGRHNLIGIVYDKSGNELGRVAPRMVSVGNNQGY